MPFRRHHEKSRHGCIQCKARKVKCDETKPVCRGCGKRGAKCSFEDATSSFVFVSEFNGSSGKTATGVAPSSSPGSTPVQIESSRAGTGSTGISSPTSQPQPPPPLPPSYLEESRPLPPQPSGLAGVSSLPHAYPGPSFPPPPGTSHVLPRIDASPTSNVLSPPNLPQSLGGNSSEGVFSAAERDNLRLMRHFVMYTHRVINKDPKAWAVWRDHVPELAFQHDFLMHMVLAIAALHMALTDPYLHPSAAPTTAASTPPAPATPGTAFSHPSPSASTTTNSSSAPPPLPPGTSATLSASPYALALHHHTLGIALFRPHMTAPVTPATIQPCFAFAALLGVFAFGSPRAQREPPDILPEIIHGMTILRGTGTIVRQGLDLLKNSPLAQLMLPQPSDPYLPLAPRTEVALAALNTKNEAVHASVPEIREAYASTISLLRNGFTLMVDSPGNSMTMVPFTIMLPDRAALGMRNGEPMALCILAYYAILLYELDNHVWLKGMGRSVVRAVWEEVDAEWRELLRWAVEDVGAFEGR